MKALIIIYNKIKHASWFFRGGENILSINHSRYSTLAKSHITLFGLKSNFLGLCLLLKLFLLLSKIFQKLIAKDVYL